VAEISNVAQSWIMCVVVGAIPITAMMQDGNGVFAAHQYARVIWAGLVVLAIAALFVQLGFGLAGRPESAAFYCFFFH
jgi:hypothetical protein